MSVGSGRADPLAADTIAAVATVPGRSALAILRISGPASLRVLRSLCPALPKEPEPRRQILTPVRNPQNSELIDHALVTWFAAPASFTGEEVVEIACHGGTMVPQLILAAVEEAGARAAEAGEFTRRAFLNGKLDMTGAEAILDLIDARSPALHRAAIHQLEGGLALRIQSLRKSILMAEARLAHSIDFPEEDEGPTPLAHIVEEIGGIRSQVELLLSTGPEGVMLQNGALVVLAGRPNAGKSSLFNALLGVDRAIVTAVPGTTRDAIEASTTLGGYPFRLVDTAGIRPTHDTIEKIGVEVAENYVEGADLILFCEEGAAPDSQRFVPNWLQDDRVIRVRTKADLLSDFSTPSADSVGDVDVSIVTGFGLDTLREVLAARAFGMLQRTTAETPILTRRRHVKALERAGRELDEFIAAADRGAPAEIAATHLGRATESLSMVIGVVSGENILDALFREFCVGK